jgi:hypothetical protein
MVLDPSYGIADDGFNSSTYYPGLMKITAADAFVVDSIAFSAAYVENTSRTSVDTIRVSFVYGSGASGTNITGTNSIIGAAGTTLSPYGSPGGIVINHRMLFDPITSTAKQNTGTPTPPVVYSYDIIINNGATPPSWTADTASNGLYVKKVPCGISVPAGNLIAATVSHLSGDVVPMWDTVFKGSPAVPPVKYNMIRPTMCIRGTNAAPLFPTYLAADKNNGAFVDKLTTNQYVPQWFWSSGTSAASVQYPDISFRISCPTCGLVTLGVGVVNSSEVVAKVYPNPANNELNVAFDVVSSSNVTVTLTNMVGQVVATENMGNVAKGTATFSTSSLPAGAYIYSINADGKRKTGRVAIAH